MHKQIIELNEGIARLHKVISIYTAIAEHSEKEGIACISPHFTIKNIEQMLKDHDVIAKLKAFESITPAPETQVFSHQINEKIFQEGESLSD
jgi:hypothetical protein